MTREEIAIISTSTTVDTSISTNCLVSTSTNLLLYKALKHMKVLQVKR